MNPLHSDKIFTYYKEAQELRRGGMVTPRMALIYPTYACNHKCPHCLYNGWNNGTSLDFDRFIRLIDELGAIGVKGIEFCGGGEPTLYPKFEEIVNYIRGAGIELGILTNGSMLSKYKELLVNNFRYVRISLDSANAKTYFKMHQVPLGNLVEDIKELVKYRNQVKSRCTIGLKRVLCELNENETLPNIADYTQDKYVRSADGELSDGKTTLEGKCWLSPIHTMIDAYGDVYICCYYQYREDAHKIGNIYKEPFKQIWFSHKHQEQIKKINPKECNKYDCRFHVYNKKMSNLFQEDDYHINFI